MSCLNNSSLITTAGANFNIDGSTSPRGFIIVTASVLIIIIFATIIGNLLVCTAILVNGQLRSLPTMLFIFSLAISDLLTATLSMPFDVDQQLVNFKWTHSERLCEAWTTAYLITVPSSIWNLLVVSADRYKSLKDPLSRYRQSPFMTCKRAVVVIVLVWVYSIVFALIPLMGWKYRNHSVENNVCYFNITVSYSILSSFVNFILPLLVMCFLYFKIFMIARNINKGKFAKRIGGTSELLTTPGKSAENAEKISKRVKRCQKRFKRNMKAAKNILIIVCAFFFCWMPHTILSLVTIFIKDELARKIPPELSSSFLLLGYLNSALNPPLYTFHNKRFKETYVKCCGLRQRKAQPQRSFNHTAMSTLEPGSTMRHINNNRRPTEQSGDAEENVYRSSIL